MSITQRQNLDTQIEMLAAQRQLYSSAKKIIGMQMIFAGPIAVIATLLGIFYPEFKNYAALLGLTILIIDLTILNPHQKKLRAQGASVQEAFDTKVLDIEWNEIKVGKKLEHELIHAHALIFGDDTHKLEKLKNWYPLEVQQLPIHWGRIVCQRSNIWWDSTLRRKFANTVFIVLIFLTIFLIWFGIKQDLSLTDFVMKIVIPMAALYKLGISQFVEHRDAADRLDKLRDQAEKLWAAAINGESLAVLKNKSRSLQDEIFDGRKKNPPIFDSIFWMFRDIHEAQMNVAASALIKEAKSANKISI